jgi:AraC-like DNA-binding protein
MHIEKNPLLDAFTSKSVDTRQHMVSLLAALAPDEGYNLTVLPDVRFLRSNRPLSRTPVLYDPGIIVVCQGRKRGYLGEQVYIYDAQHYLAVSVPVPFTMETDASEAEPLLAIYFRLDFTVASDLMLALEGHERAEDAISTTGLRPACSVELTADVSADVRAKSAADVTAKSIAKCAGTAKGMMSSPLDPDLAGSLMRFLQAMSHPVEAALLGPALVREIYYRVLTGEQGASMRAALAMQGHFGKITKAIRKIHSCYRETLDVDQLAAEANMSVPSFHAHFKTVTKTSPVQYLKSTRLHQARLLMVRNGVTAAVACAQVGYESASQFSREFKRLFGLSPVQEAERMKRSFALPPPAPGSIYIASH